ncbi:hypothetical protein FRB99_002291 [Tulasnella sp. 403]|nr:hypothetical protein FRB99_002291 [Tulasnella sp. 403]
MRPPAVRSPPQVPKDTEVTQNDPKGKGKAREVQVDEQDDTGERETAGQEDPGRERIKQLEEEVQRLKEQLAKSGPGRDSPLPPPPAPPAPPLPPPGYIAIPATSWANGPRHPSQRTPIIKPKVNKTLKPSVPLESMDAFLSELRTAKLRNTRPDQNMSPLTLRKSTHSVQETANTSTVSTGLQSLRASLRRKRPLEAEDETSMHTEADGEPEQTNNSREQEALTPPDEDDVVEVDRIDVPQEHHQRIPSMRARNSDLQLDDLQPLGRRLNLVPAVKQAPNPLPQQRPSGQADKTKSSHTGPVPGTPNVFSARPPKSPLPHQKVAQKPKPPARAATSSHNGVPHAQSPSPSPQTTRRFVHPPELSDDEDAGESTTPLQLPTKEVSAGRARQSHLQPRVSQADLITFTPSHNGPSSSKQVPRDDAREEEQSLARSLYQARKARRRFAESFSLDEELRRVAVNDRIAELELGELGDTTMGGGTQGDVELEQDVLVGFGTKPKNSTFTSGGGGGGVPVAVDNGNSSFRSEASDSSFRMKSRIPVPKGLNRSR